MSPSKLVATIIGLFIAAPAYAQRYCPGDERLRYSPDDISLGTRRIYLIKTSAPLRNVNLTQSLENLVYTSEYPVRNRPDVICEPKTATWESWSGLNNPGLVPRSHGMQSEPYYECFHEKSGVRYSNPIDHDCQGNCSRESGGNPYGTLSGKRERTEKMFPAYDGVKLVDASRNLFNIYTYEDYSPKVYRTIVDCEHRKVWEYMLRPLYWQSTDKREKAYTQYLMLTLTESNIGRVYSAESFRGL